MIYLGYLQGYDSFNVPRFRNSYLRDEYFKAHATSTIDTYYPPYFTNIIKFSSSEFDINTPYNFLMLDINNKCYYYFIRDNIYLNEDCYEIHIEMDTILTFMWNVKINDGIITRKSISRWNNNLINRNYCRENLSEGFFDNYSFEEENCYNVFLFNCVGYFDDNMAYTSDFRFNDNIFTSGSYKVMYVLVPSFIDDYPVMATANVHLRTYNDTTGVYTTIKTLAYKDYRDNITAMFNNPDVTKCNMLKIPVNNTDVILSITTTVSNNEVTDVYINIRGLGDFGNTQRTKLIKYNNLYNGGFIFSSTISNTPMVKNFSVNFTKNTNIGQAFNIKFIPQLIDENYIDIEYGSYNSTSKYPLHLLNESSYQLNTICDYSNCISNHFISPVNDLSNKYNVIVSTNAPNFDLYNDLWLQYQALNNGSLTTGIKQEFTNTVWKNVSAIAGNQYNYSANKTLSETASSEMMSNVFATKARGSEVANYTQLGNFYMDIVNNTVNRQVTRENLQNAPDTAKDFGNGINVALIKYNKIFEKIDIVNDIDAVGKKLEYYGYKVNEVIHGDYTIDIINDIRYYYNLISLNCESYTLTCAISKTLIDNFIYRLRNGIRLFNYEHIVNNQNMCDILQYDNVETEFIEEEEEE